MIRVLKAGFFDTIQDLGRFGVQKFGVPFSGAMDMYSATFANTLIANQHNDAVLEITMVGPKLEFLCQTEICLSGADLSATLNLKSLKLNTVISVKKNDILAFGKRRMGSRTYLAVKGGFQSEIIMNSRSMFQNITKKNRVIKGDLLDIHEYQYASLTHNASVVFDSNHFLPQTLEVMKGPEFSKLSNDLVTNLLSSEFTVFNQSNRMAYQFEQRFENTLESIITSSVLPGTIQLTPSGQLIILMRDAQVTGGYSRIFQLTESSINRLSQKISGGKIRLKCIN